MQKRVALSVLVSLGLAATGLAQLAPSDVTQVAMLGTGTPNADPVWQKYHSTNRTSAHELGELASRAKPGLLIVYHVLFWSASEATVLRETYDGEVVLADDLDVFQDRASLDRRYPRTDNLRPAGRKAAPENGDVAQMVRATDS